MQLYCAVSELKKYGTYLIMENVWWAPCRHSMACPHVAGGGDSCRYGRWLQVYEIIGCVQLPRGAYPPPVLWLVVMTAFYWMLQMPHVMMLLQCLAGSKQKSHKVMRTKMFAALGKAKPNIQNVKGLNKTAAKHRPCKWLSCRYSRI